MRRDKNRTVFREAAKNPKLTLKLSHQRKKSLASWLRPPVAWSLHCDEQWKQQPNPSRWQLSGASPTKASIISSLTSLTALTFFFPPLSATTFVKNHKFNTNETAWQTSVGRNEKRCRALNTTSPKGRIPDRQDSYHIGWQRQKKGSLSGRLWDRHQILAWTGPLDEAAVQFSWLGSNFFFNVQPKAQASGWFGSKREISLLCFVTSY